jgi:hypothetical protein
MRKIAILFLVVFTFVCITITAQDGNVSISETTTVADPSSILDVSSTTKGVLVPRMTTAQRTAIAAPANGLLVFDTDESCFMFFDAGESDWLSLCEGGSSADGAWLLVGNSGTDATINFLGTLDAVPLVLRTDDTERMIIFENGQVVVNNNVPFTDVVFNSFAAGTNDAIGADALDGEAIYGQTTGAGNAIYGFTDATGAGVVGVNVADSDGVIGLTTGDGVGVFGQNTLTGTAMYALNDGTGRGLETVIDNPASDAIGIGSFHNGIGRAGNFQTELATNTEPTIFAAQNSTQNNTQAAAVWAQSTTPRSGVFLASFVDDATIALNAQYSGPAGNIDPIGVLGLAEPNPGWGIGVNGQGGWLGVGGVGDDFGVLGITNNPVTGWGVFADGDIGATGTKPFVIDHPFDPENMILKHVAIESNEILNHYRGNIELDNEGKATIELPHYFEEININFSYHLTPIGAPAPNLYVSNEVKGNKFEIAGGQPGMKVSWTVQAERNDMFMKANPEKRNMEVEKNAKMKGKYLDYRSWNQPVEKSFAKSILERRAEAEQNLESQKPSEIKDKTHLKDAKLRERKTE